MQETNKIQIKIQKDMYKDTYVILIYLHSNLYIPTCLSIPNIRIMHMYMNACIDTSIGFLNGNLTSINIFPKQILSFSF